MALDVKNLPDRVYDILRRRLVSMDISPGHPIRLDALASEFAISKAPLREALARLSEASLVTLVPNRGFIASPLTDPELIDIYALRSLLEPAVAGATCQTPSPERRRAIETALGLSADCDHGADGVHRDDAASRCRIILEAMLHQPLRPATDKILFQLIDRAARYEPPLPLAWPDPLMLRIATPWLGGDGDLVARRYRQWLSHLELRSRRHLAPPLIQVNTASLDASIEDCAQSPSRYSA